MAPTGLWGPRLGLCVVAIAFAVVSARNPSANSFAHSSPIVKGVAVVATGEQRPPSSTRSVDLLDPPPTSPPHATSLVSRWLDSPLGPESIEGVGGSEHEERERRQHKRLLPLTARDVAGVVAASLVVALAAGGGIGGGGLLVPLYLLVFGFETRDAVALSNITILGGAIASFAFNLPRRHPKHRDRPLVDWNLICIMEPTTICGAVAGALLNKITPTWLTTSLLFVLLTAMTHKLVSRARSVWRLEGEERRLARAAAEQGRERVEGLSALLLEDGGGSGGGATGASDDEDAPLLLGSTLASAPSVPSLVSFSDEAASSPPSDGPKPPKRSPSRAGLFFSRRRTSSGAPPSPKPPKPPAADGDGVDGDVEARDSPLLPASSSPTTAAETASGDAPSPLSEPRLAPPAKVASIFALTLVVVAVDLAKRRVRCGSPLYWLLVSSVVPPSLAVALTARSRLVREHELRSSGARGWPRYEAGDIRWTSSASLAIPAISTFAGVFAGFFGVGGGIVKGPLMIALHVLPEVAAATSVTMILFTSSAASVVYLSFGVPTDYAVVLFALGAASTAVGQVAVARLVKKLGRPSIIVVTMAAMMLLSAVVALYEAVELTREAAREGALGRHGHIC